MSLPQLNLPSADIKFNQSEIWDVLRKKNVKLTPEEWVRQNFIHYLINHLNYPLGLLSSEYTVDYNGMKKRADIVCFNKELKPVLIVECKAPEIGLTDDTFRQIAKYAATLKSRFLILTNGLNHYCVQLNCKANQVDFLENIPDYKTLIEITKD